MDIKFWFYVFLFVIFGIPLVGFAVRNIVKFGRFIYNKYPFLQKFFDEYYEHFALGTVICALTAAGYGILYWIGIV